MDPLLLQAITVLCAVGSGFEPLAPFTTRAVQSGWGEPVNGLSIMAATDADTVVVGAALRFEIFLRFWPLDSDGRVRALNANDAEESWQLFFVRRDGTGSISSRTHARRPYRTGMPFFASPQDHVDLWRETPRSRGELFFLLSEDGQNIPSGDYVVHLIYRNSGAGTRLIASNGDECPTEEPYPPGVLWTGTVGTPLFSLHVAAREADTTRCELPTRVLLSERENGQVMWQWDPDSFEPIELISRPGFHLGSETVIRKSLGSTLVEAPDPALADSASLARFHRTFLGAWSRQLGGLPDRRVGAGAVTGPAIREALTKGEPLRVELDVTIFETSVPGGHRWDPRAGDYRVLRQYVIVETWP
jgi:hypothetical protein